MKYYMQYICQIKGDSAVYILGENPSLRIGTQFVTDKGERIIVTGASTSRIPGKKYNEGIIALVNGLTILKSCYITIVENER